jgi:hypothetical protein
MSRDRDKTSVLTIQVDVDTVRNLLAFYGFGRCEEPDDHPVYRLALPRFAELLQEFSVRATFFVIGEDLHHSHNRAIIRQLHNAGHEIANHTQTHPYHFSRLTDDQKRNEIEQAEQAIIGTTGTRPVGFRSPGYDVDHQLLRILIERGYRYDSSVMPSILNLPLKLIPALLSKKGQTSGYGSFGLSFAPNRPYYPAPQTLWRSVRAGPLLELPVSCVPYLRLPFYANFNLFTGKQLFRLSSAFSAGNSCNYVFHGIEMLDTKEIDPRLHRHPNARLSLIEKMRRCRFFLNQLQKGRQGMVTRDFVTELGGSTTTTVGSTVDK